MRSYSTAVKVLLLLLDDCKARLPDKLFPTEE